MVSRTRSVDSGKLGNTTILVTPESISSIVGFYRDRLDRERWSLVSDDLIDGSHVLKFNKRLHSLEIVVSKADDGTSVILLNRTSRNG